MIVVAKLLAEIASIVEEKSVYFDDLSPYREVSKIEWFNIHWAFYSVTWNLMIIIRIFEKSI